MFLKFYYFLTVQQFDLIRNHCQVKQTCCIHDYDKKSDSGNTEFLLYAGTTFSGFIDMFGS